MQDLLISFFPSFDKLWNEFVKSILDTLVMVGFSGLIAFFFGVFFGVILIVTRRGGIMENRIIYNIIDKAINLIRSIPFLILMMMLMGISRMLAGTGIGVRGAIFPLVCGTVPFFARQIETAIAEVDHGLVEAAQAMGSSPWQIIFRVYLKESVPNIARVTMVTAINLIGLTAMAGALGSGGLGDFAIRYGYQRHLTDMIYASVIVILILVQLIQLIGNQIIQRTKH